jgi:hypothetical protein
MDQTKQLLEFIKTDCPELQKMARQLNEREAGIILERYPFEDVKNQLQTMENKCDVKTHRSVYLTVLNWFERDIEKGYYVRPEIKHECYGIREQKADFLKKFPVGSHVDVNGEIYLVLESFIENVNNKKLITLATACNFKNITGVKHEQINTESY